MWPKLTCHSHIIQTRRYDRNNTPREQKVCLFCTAPDIEDEFHFIIKCPCYIDLRKKYIKSAILQECVYMRKSRYRFRIVCYRIMVLRLRKPVLTYMKFETNCKRLLHIKPIDKVSHQFN